MKIVALPSGEKLEVRQSQPEAKEDGLPGQMSITDFLEEVKTV